MTEEKIDAPKISVPSYGGDSITVKGLQPDEVDKLTASMRGGHHWVKRGDDGRLETTPSYEPRPEPTEDLDMAPWWPNREEIGNVQIEMFSPPELADRLKYASPSISIQHLCGYSYTPENYRRYAHLLESYGFECMRSRRDSASGQYWEVWFLPGLWVAKGDLAEAAPRSYKGDGDGTKQLNKAISFLCSHIAFGTLDVSVQRMAAVID